MDREIFNTIVWILISLLNAVAIFRAVWRSHGVERTLMWIFAILAFPGVGAIAFFLLANPYVRRTSRRKRLAAMTVRDASRRKLEGESPALFEQLFSLAATLTSFPPRECNRVELLADNDKAFEELQSAVKGAKRFVWVEYYIIRKDSTGLRFLELLAEKARAGVEVRLLYDAVGSFSIDRDYIAPIIAAGVKAETFLPINPLRRRWSVHLRNHRKLVVVDGRLGFTGGMNVGDEYIHLARRKGSAFFRDLQLLIEGPAVADLCDIFAEDWSFATEEALSEPAVPEHPSVCGAVVAVTPSGPDQEDNASALLYFGGICQGAEKIYLTSPYFIPDEPAMRALKCASLRGADVRILVPANCDVPFVGPAGRSYFPALLRSGVRIYEYLPSMLHAKTMVVDCKWGFIGSANLDMRSFRLNFELGALVYDECFAAELEKRFLEDLEQSREIDPEVFSKRGWLVHVVERIARLVSPIL
ncbi:cardiolipin synthase [bacterium]|nr:MAG: cardiolipin synthase [bacterium]